MPIIFEPTFPDHRIWLWTNMYSSCGRERSIMEFVRQQLESYPEPITLLTPTTDGIVRYPKEDCLQLSEELYETFKPKTQHITFALCTRGFRDKKIVYLPLDDEGFTYGVNVSVDSRSFFVPWPQKKPIAFWRGGLSGGDYPTVRTRFVEIFRNSKIIDAKLNRQFATPGRLGPISINDDDLFDVDRDTKIHTQHKYILIIDGAVVASALQWVFASGCVPILVTHPENEYWFKKYLKPGFHCMVVKYDLSDVEETVQWLIDHDEEAHRIAANAREFSARVFSPQFQRSHIITEIQRALAA